MRSGYLHSIPSAAGSISRLVCTRIRAAGIELAPLLRNAGLTVEQIEQRGTRVKVQSQIKLLELAAADLQDDFLGFHLARDFDLREIGLLYYVAASSELIGDALQKAERYSGTVNDGISLRLRSGNETTIVLNYIGVERRSDRHQIEFWLTSLVRICRQLTNRRLIPDRISVMHHRGTTPLELKSFLGCDIDFGANVDEVVFSESVKHLPIGSADAHLNELLLGYCEDAVLNRQRSTLRSTIENAMAPLLPHGKANADEVARCLGMSHRTLARRLSSEGLTFSEILDELKADLASRYLKEGHLQISRIAWLLGYSQVSAFTHAFKRWTGMTPRQMRGKLGSAGDGTEDHI